MFEFHSQISFVCIESFRFIQEAYEGHNKKTSGRLDDRANYTKELHKTTVAIVTAVSCPRMWREKNVNIFKDLKAKQTGGFAD